MPKIFSKYKRSIASTNYDKALKKETIFGEIFSKKVENAVN